MRHRTLSVQAGITGSTLRLILRLDSLHLGAQRVGARAYAFSYCRSSWRSSSAATPETVPVNSPVAAKKTGLLEASANTGFTVSVNVSDAGCILETTGSTSDLKSPGTVGLQSHEIDAIVSLRELDLQ